MKINAFIHCNTLFLFDLTVKYWMGSNVVVF